MAAASPVCSVEYSVFVVTAGASRVSDVAAAAMLSLAGGALLVIVIATGAPAGLEPA